MHKIQTALSVVLASAAGVYFGISFGDTSKGAGSSSIPIPKDVLIIENICDDSLVAPRGLPTENMVGGPIPLIDFPVTPAIYNLPQNMADPFAFYSISSEVSSTVGGILEQIVFSDRMASRLAKKRHTLRVLELLDINGDWTIDSSDFAVYEVMAYDHEVN